MTSTATLTSRLNKLNRDEIRILQAFAVLSQPVSQATVKDLLSALDWKDQRGRGLAALMAKPLREKLLRTGLLRKAGHLLCCHENIIEVLARRAAEENRFADIARCARRVVPYSTPKRIGYRYSLSQGELQRRLRDALYLGEEKAVKEQLFGRSGRETDERGLIALARICTQPLSPDWFARLSEDIQLLVFSTLLRKDAGDYGLGVDNALLDCLEQSGRQRGTGNPELIRLLVSEKLKRGQLSGVEDALGRIGEERWKALGLLGWLRFLQGDGDAAIACFELAQQEASVRPLRIGGMPGVCYLLALLRSGERRHLQAFDKQIALVCDGRDHDSHGAVFHVISAMSTALRGISGGYERHYNYERRCLHGGPMPEENLLHCLARHWLGQNPEETALRRLAVDAAAAHDRGLDWFARQGAAVLARYNAGNYRIKGLAALMKKDRRDTGFVLLLDLIEPQSHWQRALRALEAVADTVTDDADSGADERMSWWLSESDSGDFELQPRLQKRNRDGVWSKGRVVALRRLSESPGEFNCLTEQDREICRHIHCDIRYNFGEYSLAGLSALKAAAGHPCLYGGGGDGNVPVELHHSEPELIVKQEGDRLRLQLQPAPDLALVESPYELLWESRHRLRLIAFDDQHLRIAGILGKGGLTVPLSAREQVLQSIGAIAPLLAIQSDIGGGSAGATEVDPDQRLHVHIQPAGQALKFNAYVQPLHPGGPLFRPGEGGATVLAEIEGRRLQTTRALPAERDAFEAVLARCPALRIGQGEETPSASGEWLLSEEPALEALLQLRDCGDRVEMAWPQGGRLEVAREIDLDQMRISVRRERDWFAVEGEVSLDDDKVLSLEHLLGLLELSPGRFIRLGENRFLTLTRSLRQRLGALRSHGNHARFHPLAATALEELTEGMRLSADKPWRAQLANLREAYRQQPEVPATLRAELRDYQREGFQWLARLAHWGAGACLADDMGLGKTLQSLALIVSRAAQGPSLILAPTSVCMNWIEEAERFAPALTPLRFGGGDRQAMLDMAGPFDLVVCSYGLLQNEAERLAGVDWHTVVADEAQALKNPQTKRARAALALPGAFKMVTTGTPIENHLGELWSLFQFINPGLLGTLRSFNERFANPIENQRDPLAGQQLKRLVRPFILRRLKSDVLAELPPRTEITLHVTLSDEEAAFYEALRRQALERLADSADNPGRQRIRVLAEIMRLRRACCNPRLIMSDSPIPSAKLEAFGGILDELRENRHRALVFSQFVDHLTLLREYLDERGVVYQYLDGATPVKKRQQAVRKFQDGEGELFLISLKAGGSGLNLTAADYVVHMDPWWNPAVEDQASDRAHRLGQRRPVTIYRLVAENTIEQKIVSLHQHKRDLADSLLEGSDVSGKLSLEDMVGLIGDVEASAVF